MEGKVPLLEKEYQASCAEMYIIFVGKKIYLIKGVESDVDLIHHKAGLILIIASCHIKTQPIPLNEILLAPCNI